jgi:hypothetical protein
MNYQARSRDPFAMIKDHVLLRFADAVEEADATMSARITVDSIERVVKLIPDDWLVSDSPFAEADRHRDAYVEYLSSRLQAPRAFAGEAIRARS